MNLQFDEQPFLGVRQTGSSSFCDTDSLAISNTSGLTTGEFVSRVEAVRAWFEPLNPYEKKGSILQLEKVNFPPGRDGVISELEPVNCLAISAKRYVLFNPSPDNIIIRKASAHGLGHLVAPYADPIRGKRIGQIGVELWQEELWREIIKACDKGTPDQVDYGALRNFDQPAASRYAATNQTLLKWFNSYNEQAKPNERVWPFNFLLSYQAKSLPDMMETDADALRDPAWRKRTPHPASRYSSNLIDDQPLVFDRKTGEPIPWHWLKTVGRSLVRHHLHSEMKFLGGADDQRGTLQRRHIKVWIVSSIGKEADNLEMRETLGEGEDGIGWAIAGFDRKNVLADIENVLTTFNISDAELLRQASVSHHTLAALRTGQRLAAQSLLQLAQAVEALRQRALRSDSEMQQLRKLAKRYADEFGSDAKLAEQLGFTRQYITRVLKGEKPMTTTIRQKLTSILLDFRR